MPILTGLLNMLLVISSIFLICLVLIQRGKGGGLAGAFGGVGGSSAFGTKAGDVFTRVTIVTAVIWFVLAMMLVVVNNQERRSAFDIGGTTGSSTAVELPGSAEAAAAAAKAKAAGAGVTIPAPATTSPAPTTTAPATAAPASGSALPAALEDQPAPTSTTPPQGAP